MKFLAYTENGKLKMSNYFSSKFDEEIKKDPKARWEIVKITPESKKLRRYYFSILKLWCYLDGNDYKNGDLIDMYHDTAKIEFNGEMVRIGGKLRKVGKTTRNGALKAMIEPLISYLENNYGIDRAEVLNPDEYKYFMDVVYSDGKHNDFIDYLIDLRKLENKKVIKVMPWRR